MKKLKISIVVNTVLGFLAVPALILLYLALSDIAENSGNSPLEWYIAGISMMILSAFTVSTFISLWLMFKSLK